MLTEEKRGVEEAYQCASTSSNLRLMESDRQGRCDADVLIAAGLSKQAIGSAAIRLRGEWDRAEKPRVMAKEQAIRVASSMPPARKDETVMQRLARHYAQELILLSGKLKSFRAVAEPLADRMGISKEVAAATVLWWLDQKCQACGGTKWQVVEGSNRHGNKLCRPCGGSGYSRAPSAEVGKKAANYIDDCVQDARTLIKKRLRPE